MNFLAEIFLRFVVPIGCLVLCLIAGWMAMTRMSAPGSDSPFLIHVLVISTIGICVSIVGLVVSNFRRFRRMPERQVRSVDQGHD
jgi:hypothetical protein